MKSFTWRMRFVYWLHHKVFKRGEGEIMHPICIFLFRLLHPILYLLGTNDVFNAQTLTYTINKIKFSTSFFMMIGGLPDGAVLRLGRNIQDEIYFQQHDPVKVEMWKHNRCINMCPDHECEGCFWFLLPASDEHKGYYIAIYQDAHGEVKMDLRTVEEMRTKCGLSYEQVNQVIKFFE